MIQLTDAAAAEIRSLMQERDEELGLRLYVEGKSCCGPRYGLMLSGRMSGDLTVESSGIRLFISPKIRETDMSIDYISRGQIRGFVIRMERETCRCR
ncbi:MAG TPA: iron-sulfur cluster assembly accessory protein [Candidatus Methanoperedenaceae archaeon]|nr:iron-sulfur cluster assembly accessory protein [Candidatus Methanoperedenaceae archaeon]